MAHRDNQQGALGYQCMRQLASEVTKAEREELLGDAQLPVVIPTDQALAMKADLAIPWNKLRILRR